MMRRQRSDKIILYVVLLNSVTPEPLSFLTHNSPKQGHEKKHKHKRQKQMCNFAEVI